MSGLSENTWNVIKVEAIGNYISIFINNQLKESLSRLNRPDIEKVYVYASDKYYQPANASIKRLTFRRAITSVPSLMPSLSLVPSSTGIPSSYRPPSSLPSISILPTVYEIILTSNNLIDTIDNPPSEFILTFDIFPFGLVDSWSSILRYTRGNFEWGYESRWIYFQFAPNAYKLHFVTASIINDNRFMTIGIERNQWNTVKLEASENKIKLFINNIYYCFHSNGSNIRPPLDKVYVYAADRFLTPAKAKLRSLVFSPLTQEPTTVPSSSYFPSLSHVPSLSFLPSLSPTAHPSAVTEHTYRSI